MRGVLFADRAVFFQLETVGVVTLVLEAVVIPVLALGTLERNFHSGGFRCHSLKLHTKKLHPFSGA